MCLETDSAEPNQPNQINQGLKDLKAKRCQEMPRVEVEPIEPIGPSLTESNLEPLENLCRVRRSLTSLTSNLATLRIFQNLSESFKIFQEHNFATAWILGNVSYLHRCTKRSSIYVLKTRKLRTWLLRENNDDIFLPRS